MMWHVYGVFVDDAVQYVGFTDRMQVRKRQHAAERFAGKTFEMRIIASLPTKKAAIRKEAQTIRRLKPPMNIAMNPNRPPVERYERVTDHGSRRGQTVLMRIRRGTMPIDEAEAIWINSASIKDALARMTGWSAQRAYTAFGKRGGRRS